MTRHARIELRPAKPGCPPLSRMSTGPYCTEHAASAERPLDCPQFAKPSARPHYLRLVSANGQVLAHSETYSTRANARRAVKAWTQAFAEVWDWTPYGMDPAVVELDADGTQVRP